MCRNVFKLFNSIIPDVRQYNIAILNFPEKMFAILRADGNEINTTAVIVPISTCGFYSVSVVESVV